MPLALTGATGLHRAMRNCVSCEARLQAGHLAAQPAFDVDATYELGQLATWLERNWPERNRSAALDFGELSTIGNGVRSQYEIAFNAIIAINTTAKPQPNNIVLL
jgi:hypothetical protein